MRENVTISHAIIILCIGVITAFGGGGMIEFSRSEAVQQLGVMMALIGFITTFVGLVIIFIAIGTKGERQ